MRHHDLLAFILLFILSGCAGTGKEEGRPTKVELANRQWQVCSYYPNVELVEITSEGKLLVRDSSYSSPPVDFLQCIARTAYVQVLSGDREAKSLIRDAYFVNAKPDRKYLYKPSGHFPLSNGQFTSEQSVFFSFVVEVPYDTPIQVSFEWNTPSGDTIRVPYRQIMSTGAAARKWSFEELNMPHKPKGRWSLRLYIDSFDAGEYFFDVV